MDLPTLRLSPKNQVTLLKGARALVQAEEEGYVCGRIHTMLKPGTDQAFRVVVLMSESQLEALEDRLREQYAGEPVRAEAAIARLNGSVHRMNLDAQRRIVLPQHFVSYLGLERDVFMYSTNRSVMVWKPEDYAAYVAEEPEEDSDAAYQAPPVPMV